MTGTHSGFPVCFNVLHLFTIKQVCSTSQKHLPRSHDLGGTVPYLIFKKDNSDTFLQVFTFVTNMQGRRVGSGSWCLPLVLTVISLQS